MEDVDMSDVWLFTSMREEGYWKWGGIDNLRRVPVDGRDKLAIALLDAALDDTGNARIEGVGARFVDFQNHAPYYVVKSAFYRRQEVV